MAQKQSKKSKRILPRYNTDGAMLQLRRHMIEDLRPIIGELLYRRLVSADRPAVIREQSIPTGNVSPYKFKALWQLENLCKRYIFADDPVPYDVLCDKSLDEFKDFQETIGGPVSLSDSTQRVVNRAKSVIADVLGEYDEAEHRSLCRFGPKAAKGVPYTEAYLDCKMDTLSGTHEQQYWFLDQLGMDFHLRDAVLCKEKEIPQPTVSINVTPVPKTWKSARIIAPDTVCGSFSSQGLGRYYRRKLEERTHISLRYAKDKHMELACRSSRSGYHATTDLKRASDCFTLWHLKWLPHDWFDATIRVSMSSGELNYHAGGKVFLDLKSRCLMGTGFTFPLETLFFYAMLRAIGDLLGSAAKVYVFGDDLIYPSRWHKYVAKVFSECGFIINREKTFFSGDFRESCGGDYYRGVDVRPFMPKGSTQNLGPLAYEAWCYSMINQLSRRWSHAELERTFNFLLLEAAKVSSSHGVLIVPERFPEYSGVRRDNVDQSLAYNVRFSKSTFDSGTSLMATSLIATRPVYRLVEKIRAYYWDHLRTRAEEESDCEAGAELPNYQFICRWKELIRQELRRWIDETDLDPAPAVLRRLEKGDLIFDPTANKVRQLKKGDKLVGLLATARRGTIRYRRTTTTVVVWKEVARMKHARSFKPA